MYGWSPLWLQNKNSLKQQHWWLQVPSLNDMIVEAHSFVHHRSNAEL